MAAGRDASQSLTDFQVQADGSTALVAANGPELLGIAGVLLGLACSVVLLRIWARQVILRTLGWDDAAMLLAMGLAIVSFVFFVGLVRAGGGQRADTMSPEDQADFKFCQIMIGVCAVTGICLVKISVGFFLRRFLQTRLLRRLVVGFIGFISVYLVYSILTFVLMCTPTRVYWNSNVAGTCWSARTLSIVGNLNAAINITTDFFTWLLPVWVIIKLQLKRRAKITLLVIMSLGLFAVIASILRVFLGSAWMWSCDLYIWLNIEVDTAILAASLPCLRPIFRNFLGSTNEPSYPQGPSRSGRPTTGARSGYARQTGSIALTSVSRKEDSFKPYSREEVTYKANVTSAIGVSRLGGENSSKDAILQPHGITKTTETSIFVSKV